jgi:transposase-like protein
MGKIQKQHSPQFKADVVLESLITGNVSATANRNQIHESVLRRWRKEFRDKLPSVFSASKSSDRKEMERLERIIGRLTIEKEILKKTMELVN